MKQSTRRVRELITLAAKVQAIRELLEKTQKCQQLGATGIDKDRMCATTLYIREVGRGWID